MTSVIKVDNIQNSSGTDAISIDSNGVVTRPVVPAWRVISFNETGLGTGTHNVRWQSATGTVSTSNSFLLGGVTQADEASGTYKDIIVPVQGLYQINVNIRVDNLNTGYISLNVTHNGSTINDVNTIEGSPASNYQTLQASVLYYLNANDKIEVMLNPSTDTSWDIDGTNDFSGFLVG
jgi:hypothetical protein